MGMSGLLGGRSCGCLVGDYGEAQRLAEPTGDLAMEYVRLGGTGLNVSRLALGCMSYGDPTTPGAHEWSLVDEHAQPFFRQAIELGITFWDTATSIRRGPRRRSSAGRSSATRGGRTSCWPPR